MDQEYSQQIQKPIILNYSPSNKSYTYLPWNLNIDKKDFKELFWFTHPHFQTYFTSLLITF